MFVEIDKMHVQHCSTKHFLFQQYICIYKDANELHEDDDLDQFKPLQLYIVKVQNLILCRPCQGYTNSSVDY